MEHQLILFYGSSPGAGKSTLSSRLNQQLTQHNLPVQWIYEDDVLCLDFFQPVVECVQGGGGPELVEACLVATERLVDAYVGTDTIVIADSILPYYDWLLAANIDNEIIGEFSHRLWLLLQPMNPLIIYLQADVEKALKRAVAYRGEAWLERSIVFMNSWGSNQAQPLHNLDDVIAYGQQTDRTKQQLLSQWAGDILRLDSVAQPLEVCVETLLLYLDLRYSASPSLRSIALVDCANFVGHYLACDDEPPGNQQTITVSKVADELRVDLYWPNGCRLVPNGNQAFQLQDTSHWVEFVEPKTDASKLLRYHYRGEIYTYEFQSA